MNRGQLTDIKKLSRAFKTSRGYTYTSNEQINICTHKSTSYHAWKRNVNMKGCKKMLSSFSSFPSCTVLCLTKPKTGIF